MKSFGARFYCTGILSVLISFLCFSPPHGLLSGSETLPAGFHNPPTVSEALSAGSKALQASFEALPAGSEALALSAGSGAFPAGPEAFPAGSEVLSANPS